jgi:hypothetical protein
MVGALNGGDEPESQYTECREIFGIAGGKLGIGNYGGSSDHGVDP